MLTRTFGESADEGCRQSLTNCNYLAIGNPFLCKRTLVERPSGYGPVGFQLAARLREGEY